MRYIKFLVLAVFVLTGCAKERDLRVLCKGTLTKIEFKNNEEIILDKNDEFLNQYQITQLFFYKKLIHIFYQILKTTFLKIRFLLLQNQIM